MFYLTLKHLTYKALTVSLVVFQRARAATTLSQTDNREREERLLPTVFKWEAGGKDVYLSGTFNNWKAKIPLAKR